MWFWSWFLPFLDGGSSPCSAGDTCPADAWGRSTAGRGARRGGRSRDGVRPRSERRDLSRPVGGRCAASADRGDHRASSAASAARPGLAAVRRSCAICASGVMCSRSSLSSEMRIRLRSGPGGPRERGVVLPQAWEAIRLLTTLSSRSEKPSTGVNSQRNARISTPSRMSALSSRRRDSSYLQNVLCRASVTSTPRVALALLPGHQLRRRIAGTAPVASRASDGRRCPNHTEDHESNRHGRYARHPGAARAACSVATSARMGARRRTSRRAPAREPPRRRQRLAG